MELREEEKGGGLKGDGGWGGLSLLLLYPLRRGFVVLRAGRLQ